MDKKNVSKIRKVTRTKKYAQKDSKPKDAGKGFHLSKVWKLIIFLAILFCFASFMTFLYYINFVFIDYKEMATNVMITPTGMGLNGDRDALYFGKNFPGGWAQRSFYLKSEKPALVRISVSGNISSMIEFSENNFVLEPNESKRIYADLNVPLGTESGNYSGKIKVYLLKP